MPQVHCFGKFDVFVDGQSLKFSRSKTKELFAYLVDRNGTMCNSDDLLSILWPDDEPTNSLKQQLRNLIFDLNNTIAPLTLKKPNKKDLYNELKKNHLVLSEYPFNVAPCKKLFPYRNRIVSALSSKILITQSRVKSGTMITAGYALEQGKDVYCVPGRFYDFEGCNKLINQGAYLVHDVKDIDSIENYS